MHMGDTFFNGAYPFVDLSTGGSIRGLLAAVDTALARSNAATKIIPGHGPLGTRADLIRYRDVVRTVRDRVARLVLQRRTLAQVLAAKPSAEFDAKWGAAFIKPDVFVTTVYQSLAQPRSVRR